MGNGSHIPDSFAFQIREIAGFDSLYHRTQKMIRRAIRVPFQNDAGAPRPLDDQRVLLSKLLDLIAEHLIPKYGLAISPAKKEILDYLFLELSKRILDSRDFWLFAKALSLQDHVTPRFRVYQIATNSYMAYAGISLDVTLRFAEAYFERLQCVFCKGEAISDPQEKMNWTTKELSPLIFICFASAVSLSGTQFPQKQWILNLIRNSEKGNVRVDEALKKFICALSMVNGTIHIATESGILQQLESQNKTVSQFVPPSFDVQNPLIILPDDCATPFEVAVMKRSEEIRELEREADRFRQWFAENHEQVEERHHQKIREIKERYMYAILPGGLDSIKVSLSELQLVGILKVSFFPEGHLPPDCTMRVQVLKELDAVCTYEGTLRDFKLEIPDDVFANYRDIPIAHLKLLFTMLVVDSLHYICVLNESPNGTGARSASRMSTFSGQRYRRTQRAMLRHLPAGWNASDHARELAQSEQGWVVPHGRTYVKQFDVNRMHPQRPVDIPILDYSDLLFRSF